MSCNRATFLALLLTVSAGGVAEAGVVSVTKRAGTGTATLDEFSRFDKQRFAYTDRTSVLDNIPMNLSDNNYIRLANDARTDETYQVDVKVNFLTLFYLFLDDRYGDGDKTDPPTGLPGWMTDGSIGLAPFIDTGANVDIDEDDDRIFDNTFSVFVTLALPGATSVFREQNDGPDRNMYIIAIGRSTDSVPEPGGLVLAGLGVAGVLAYGVRRRRSAC